MRRWVRLVEIVAALVACGLGAVPSVVHAGCTERSLRTWPEPGAELPASGRITIEGQGQDRAAVLELARRGPRLRTQGHEVELAVTASYLGHRNVATVVLAPAANLVPGATYRLAFARRPREAEVLSAERLAPGAPGSLAWRVTAEKPAPPLWIAQPWFVAFEATDAADHPRHARITVEVAATRSWRLVAEVEGRGRPQRYLLDPRRAEVRLGGDDCAAPFRLDRGQRYRVTLSAVDLAGHVAPAPGKPVEFAVP
jgi:hypothetical protein